MGELELMKLMTSLSGTGLAVGATFIMLRYFSGYLKDQQVAFQAKDNLTRETIIEVTDKNNHALDRIGQRLEAMGVRFEGIVKGLEVRMVEMDREHTASMRDTFGQVVALTKDQHGITSQVVHEINGIKGEVGEIKSTLDDHGRRFEQILPKLDEIGRMLPQRSRPAAQTPDRPETPRKLEPPRNS